ncbi:MAG: hypothetical protein AAF438_03860 [Pseudomonadota bacterium]
MRKLPTQVLVFAAILGWPIQVLASEAEPTMTIYADVAGAEELVAKDYTAAIEKMLEARKENPLFLFNNLCVAYTLSGQLVAANDACKEALEQVDRWRNYGDDWFERRASTRIRKQHRLRAIAHLNVLGTLESAQVAAAPSQHAPAPESD